MLGDIDITKKPYKPQIYLCKPDLNRSIIGKLNYAYNVNLTVTLGKVNELSFDLPYQVDIRHSFKRNPNIDNVRVHYLIKFVYGEFVEYYVIDKISEGMDSNGDKKTIHTYSLGYQLINKRVRNYQKDSLMPPQVLDDVLSESTWKVGYIDPVFHGMYRGFNISSSTVLDAVYQIADTYSALVTFDTENKLVNLIDPDYYGQDKGLNFKYGKYLKSLGNDIDTSNMFTQIKAYGKDDLTVGAVNPTGSDAIENFSFFLQPFQRDSNKKVTSSSLYMSDDLCNAILDYEELCASKTDDYKSLIKDLTDKQTTLTNKQNDLQSLNDQLAMINDNLDLQRSVKTLSIYNLTYNGSTVSKTFTLDSSNDYVIMSMASSASNISLTLGQLTKTFPGDNQWMVFTKLTNNSSVTLQYSGSSTNNKIVTYIVAITSDEFKASKNDTDLLTKYNDIYEQSLIDVKQTEVDSAQSDVDNTQSQINAIVTQLSIGNNFTPDQITERDAFVITYEWVDSNYIDAQSLYDEAVNKLKELQSPPASITIDVINFLEVVESQKEWDKLVLGDKVRISYDLFNLDIKAQINEIQYNFENSSIKLTISNIKDLKDDKKKFLKKLYKSINAANLVGISKSTWDTAKDANTKIDNYTSSPIDATKQPITAGVNQTVTIDSRGITYTDPNNSNNKVISQAGTVALSTDGGTTWKPAITPQGTQAEQLIGQIILGSVLNMTNSSGNMTFDDNGLTLSTTDKSKRILINESDGIKIQQSSDGGTTWADQFYVDSNGQLIAKGIALYTPDGTEKIFDGTAQTLDFSNLKQILGQIIFNNDSGDTISDFGSNSAGFSSLSVGHLTSPSIYNATFNDTSISLSGNISSALHTIPPLNNGTATLTFQNDISENIDISNYLGDGSIVIDLNGHTLNGNLYIHGCSPQYVYIKNGTINGTGIGTTVNNAVVEITRSTYVHLDSVKIYGNNSPSYGVFSHDGASAYISNCEIYNVKEAITALNSAIVTCDNCKGLGSLYGLHSYYGGYITAFGSQPGGSSSNTVGSSGQVFPNGGTTVNTGSATPPSPPAQTSSWNSIGGNNWSNLYNSWSNDGVKQGNYGYGRRSGYWFFGTSPTTTVTGKTINSMRIKVTRLSQGGNSGDVSIVLRSHNYVSQPSSPSPLTESSYSATINLAWGQSAWVSLPSTFFADFESGLAKGIGIYVDSDSNSNYAIMDSSSILEITYS